VKATSGRGAAPVAVATIDAQTLARVSQALAAHIGPIAEVVVRRAAKRASSLEEFYANVANEIESEADRARFLKACRI
jgi:serine/threonine-protein kinase